jgi:SAM-dependent methyltransferase
MAETFPVVHDRSSRHELDPHYFYVNCWAIRSIIKAHPQTHVDVASQTILAGLLSSIIPVTYLDYRLLNVDISGLKCIQGSVTDLPFSDNSVASLSCLHVAEHIGLGRYGDPLDPCGTQKAIEELKRVLSPGGDLYFAIPIGRQRVCFNAHRIYLAETIRDYFSDLKLVDFSGVHDSGVFVENVDISQFRRSEYACGMFHFTK